MTASFGPLAGLDEFTIEVPSWAFGNSGTRFKVFAQPGVPRDPVREDRRRRPGAPRHRAGAVGRAAHPVGPGRRLRHSSPRTPRTSASGSARSTRTPFQDDDYKFGSSPTSRAGAAEGDRSPRSSASTSWTRPGRRDLKIWLADGTNYPGQGDLRDRRIGWPTRCARSTPRSARTSGWCSSTSSSSRHSTPPTSRTGAPPTLQCLALGRARGRASTPATTRRARTSSSSSCSCCGSAARCVRLQLPLLRRRRPDRRRRRSVPAVPHPVRGRRGGGYRPGGGRGLHARPVPQHRGQDPRPDPLGAQRAGDDGPALLVDGDALAAAAARRATSWARNDVLMDAFYTDVRGAAGRLARRPRPARRPDAPPTGIRATRTDRRRPGRRHPGRMGRVNPRPLPTMSPPS